MMKQKAVILAAGFGSRLSRFEGDTPKPLREVGGLALIQRNLAMLEHCGVRETIVVLGHRAREIALEIQSSVSLSSMKLTFVHNPHYTLSNGLSVLAARPHLSGDFLLLMADHIFDLCIFEGVAGRPAPKRGASLCIDYKINSVFDIDDATKVVTDGVHVCEISKALETYNAIDTGLFLCSQSLLDALEEARSQSPEGDCSLSDGVTELARHGRMFVHDIGHAYWQDVDTELALRHAERLLREGLMSKLDKLVAAA